MALFFMDLDRFKIVNDSLGHAAGDRLLQLVAERLQTMTRKNDILARLGGDEFLLLCADVEETTEADSIAQRFIDAIGTPFVLDDRETVIGSGIGVVVAVNRDVNAGE